MKLHKILQTGDEVWVKSEDNRFITMIDEVGDDTLTIFGPADPAQRLWVKPDLTFLISCATERGLYMLDVRVKDVSLWNSVMLVQLEAISEYKKIQRREAFRAKEQIEVNVRRLQPIPGQPWNWGKSRTVNISETGMLLQYHETCAVGLPLEIEMVLNLYGMNEVLPKIHGKVTRCTRSNSRKFEYLLGIHFEDIPDNVRNSIIKLVVLSQRNQLTYRYSKRY